MEDKFLRDHRHPLCLRTNWKTFGARTTVWVHLAGSPAVQSADFAPYLSLKVVLALLISPRSEGLPSVAEPGFGDS